MKKCITILMLSLMVFSIVPSTSNACEYPDKVYETETIETIADTDDVTVSEVMTFDEMVADYAKTSDISYEQALKEFSPCICRSRSNDTYRKLGVTIKVTNSYKPTLYFYCETCEYGQYWGIKNIYSVHLNRKYNGMSKQFEGEIEVYLRSAYEIEYIVDGDFYDNGTTTCTNNTGLSIGLGDVVTITFGTTVTTTSDHYACCYQDDTVKFQK